MMRREGVLPEAGLGFWLSAIAGGGSCGILHTGQYRLDQYA